MCMADFSPTTFLEMTLYRMVICGSVPGCTPCNDLLSKAPPERGTLFRLQVYERFHLLKYIKGR